MKLSEYLAIKKDRTNAGLLALMAYGASAAFLAAASWPTSPENHVYTAFCYAGLGFLLGNLEIRQCKKKRLSDLEQGAGE